MTSAAGFIVPIAACALSLTACADAKAAEGVSKELDVVDAANDSPTGTAGAATPVTDAQIFDQVSAAVCDADRRTLETAIDAFVAMQGRPPTDEAELVGTLLRTASTSYDVAPDGTLIPAPGSTCT